MKKISHALIFLLIGCSSVLQAQENSANNAVVLLADGHRLSSEAEYEKAGQAFQGAMELFLQQGDSVKWAEAYLNYGETLVDQGKVQRGLDIFIELNQSQPSNISFLLQAQIMSTTGWAYAKLEKYMEAKGYYEEALKLARAAEDTMMMARVHNNISRTEHDLGNFEAALEHVKTSLGFYRLLNNDYRLALALNNLFSILSDFGLYKQAEGYLRESLIIREELGNPDLLDVGYHNMAWLFKQQGKLDSAIVYYQRSLELSRMLNNPYDITTTLLNIGGLYEQAGDYENALLYYNEALEYNRKTNRPVSIADNLSKIARIAQTQGDFATAESFYQEALSKLRVASTPQKLSTTYYRMAEMEIARGNFEEATQLINQGLETSDQRSQQARGHLLLGNVFAFRNEYEKSLDKYRKSYASTLKGSPSALVGANIMLARAFQKVHSDSAFIYAERAFSAIDSIRTNVAGLTFRAGFFSDYAEFYNEVALWYILEKNNANKAYELVETANARVLMDELAEAENELYQKLDESTLIKKQQMQKQIDQLHGKIRVAEGRSDKERLRNELKDIEFRYQTFINEMRQQIPEWNSFTYPDPLTAEEVMDMVGDETAILEYAFAQNYLIRFLITSDEISAEIFDEVEHDGTNMKEFLVDEIRAFRNHIIKQEGTYDSSILYAYLMPSEASLPRQKIQQLLIIPEGVISFLPFEAMKVNGEYLIQRYAIKYLPSASMYPLINTPHRTTNSEMLAVAGSGFEGAEGLGDKTRSQRNFASLPSTLLEVESIAEDFKQAKVIKNEDVTEANLKSHNLADFRYIHFATHGNIDEVNPSQSGLILSKKEEVESLFGEDGYLNSAEISGLRLNADLVTLSACNTGMGKIITGEGLLGLQRSFLSAGASSVMVSLWNVYDRSTSVFMASFYEKMLNQKAEDYGMWSQALDWMGLYEHPVFDYKAKALRETKLAMIDHPYYSHPVHWAPFILIGK